MKRNKGGRPPKAKGYKNDLPVKLRAFYDRSHLTPEGKMAKLPYLVDFCKQEGIKYSTLMRWLAAENRDDFQDLHDAYVEAKALLERNIVESAFGGKANAIFAVHVTKNMLGWSDKKDFELSAGKGWASAVKRNS